jgi:hypothetical protein
LEGLKPDVIYSLLVMLNIQHSWNHQVPVMLHGLAGIINSAMKHASTGNS